MRGVQSSLCSTVNVPAEVNAVTRGTESPFEQPGEDADKTQYAVKEKERWQSKVALYIDGPCLHRDKEFVPRGFPRIRQGSQ